MKCYNRDLLIPSIIINLVVKNKGGGEGGLKKRAASQLSCSEKGGLLERGA